MEEHAQGVGHYPAGWSVARFFSTDRYQSGFQAIPLPVSKY